MRENKDFKTALYCRSAQACDIAVAMQERLLREFAEKNGCENPSCYIDNGASGVTLDRPAMNRLLSDIRGGGVDTVIAKDTARIARSFIPFMEFRAEARKHGVTIITVLEGEIESNPLFQDWSGVLLRNTQTVRE
jgi:DNA invertase Pin-like site-specific DNA recombinase